MPNKITVEEMPNRGRPKAWYVSHTPKSFYEHEVHVFKTKRHAVQYAKNCEIVMHYDYEGKPDIVSIPFVGWLWRGKRLVEEIGEHCTITDHRLNSNFVVV